MTDDPFVVVARVVKTHGLKGEVSVVSATGTPFRLLAGAEVWFAPPVPGVGASRVSSVRATAKGELAAFDGVVSIDVAQRLVGSSVMVRSQSLPASWLSDEGSEHDYTGFSVCDPRHGELGELTETIETGANDVWVVEGRFGEVLIPVIDDVVVEVDEAAGRIVVQLLEGLLPEGSEQS